MGAVREKNAAERRKWHAPLKDRCTVAEKLYSERFLTAW